MTAIGEVTRPRHSGWDESDMAGLSAKVTWHSVAGDMWLRPRCLREQAGVWPAGWEGDA